MRKVPVEEAVGLTLCHDITAINDRFKGPLFRRGHVIGREDIGKLLDIGKRHVFIWEESAGEIHEEDAAVRLAAICYMEDAVFSGPSEGKMVATAGRDGFFRVNVPLQRKINGIGDITICSIPDHYPVRKGQRLCSMRIIPLVTEECRIEEAERLASEAEAPLMQLFAYRPLKSALLITGSEIYSGRTKDLFEPVLRKKLSAFPGEVLDARILDDDPDAIRDAITEMHGRGADLILMTGGMSVDPDDVTPSAIRASGARVISHGVPSQPGNMLMAAYLGDTCILGVPGAAAKLPTTTLDVFLPQIFAGIPITKQDLIALGDGGFCQNCGECHWPNCTFGRY